MPTRAEIDDLKAQWDADPCWDIEDTEGFEEHREELLAFHDEKRKEWRRKMQIREQAKAHKLQCSVELARYILDLEYTIDKMQENFTQLEEKCYGCSHSNRN